MKSVVVVFACMTCLLACSSSREIQVERVNAHVVRIDTLFRESGNLKAITWQDENRLRYYSLEPIESRLSVGTSMGMLIRK